MLAPAESDPHPFCAVHCKKCEYFLNSVIFQQFFSLFF